MSTRERLTLAVALAVALGSAAIAPLYEDLLWLPHALGAILCIAGIGLVLRRFSVPGLLQPLGAFVILFEYVAVVFVRTTLRFGFIPTGRTIPALRELVDDGLSDIAKLAPPVPTDPGLVLMAVLGVGAVAIVVDVIAVVMGRAALAGLPLLVLFAVPSAVHPDGLGWLPFTLGAIGWLSLLLVEGGDRVGRWGTPLKAARPERGAVYEDTSLGRVGRRIGAAALGVAVFVPAMIPGLDARLLGNGEGDGTGGGGSRTTTTYNPITRLRADLRLPEPRLILTYKTNDETPDYLRLTTLDRFSDAGWSASKLSGSPKEDGVEDGLPSPIGLTGPTRDIRDVITIKTLEAQWLPTPFPPKDVDVSGPWLYDDRSETIYGIRVGTKKMKKKTYTVSALEVSPDPAELSDPTADQTVPSDIASYVTPPVVTQAVEKLTEEIVAGKATPYQKVAAIQAFFTDPDQNFEYSQSSQVRGIDSPSDLANFLKGRRGFCEQYASAMGAMIRLAGVPARVAVGFTAGARQADGSYAVTTDDAHAWPEAWFRGVGWVRFEPTPRDGYTVVPSYALPALNGPTAGGPDDPTAPKPGADTGADGESSNGVQDKLDRLDPDAAVAPPADGDQAGTGSRLPSLWLVGLLALAVLALLPGLLHTLRLRRRWHTPGPLVAWSQVYDDARDVGHTWRAADSPRAAALHLQQARDLPEAARAALDRLAGAAERARYARTSDGAADGLRADAAAVRSALLAGAGTRARWQARLMPTSTLQWASSAIGTFVADALDRFDDGWAAVRRLLRLRSRAA